MNSEFAKTEQAYSENYSPQMCFFLKSACPPPQGWILWANPRLTMAQF